MSEVEEDNAGQEERIDWLKDRGVEIEFPADRKNKAKSTSTVTRLVKVVKIPCDDRLPYEELNIPVEAGKSGDMLVHGLKQFFGEGSIELSLLKDAAAKQFSSDSINISSSTVDKMAQMGSVELFPLAHPNDSNSQCKVGLYLDEAGQLKGLSPNHRATALANSCGFNNVPLVGDMYVGRSGLVNGQITNMDFTIDEMDSSARWLKDVTRQNYEHGLRNNRVVMDSDLATADVSNGVDEARGLRWSESEELMEVTVRLPGDTAVKISSKDVKVKFSGQAVSVQLKDASTSGGFLTVLDLRLAGVVRPDECTWSLSGPREIELSMEKAVAGTKAKWHRLEGAA